MLDTIVIRPNSSRDHPLDCGQMIENLFFYKNTIAHIGRHEIRTLFDLADVDVLENLLRLPYLKMYYNNSHAGVMMQGDGVRGVDSFGLADLDLEKELYEESFQHRKDKQRSVKFSKKISRLLKVYQLPEDFNKTLIEQLKDEEFRSKVLKATIKSQYPENKWSLDNSHYELEFLDATRFKVHTDIDFGTTDKVTIDSPLLALINACEDIQVMSEFSSEISVPEFNSEIIRLKLGNAFDVVNKEQKPIEVFTRVDIEDSFALREAINSKQILVKAVLKLFENAEKHRWIIRDLPPNTELLLEYLEALRNNSKFDNIYLKTLRFYLFNGAGFLLNAINPAIGIPATVGLNAFDAFLLDKLIQKWTPHQLIEGELRPILAKA